MPNRTISALQSKAARSDDDLAGALLSLSDARPDELARFFGSLNIPRTLREEPASVSERDLGAVLNDSYHPSVTSLAEEEELADRFTFFHTRHLRKLQWHATRPDPRGVPNAQRLYHALVSAVEVRLIRLLALLEGRHELSPVEWGVARALVNRALADFRDATVLIANRYCDALSGAVADAAVAGFVGPIRHDVSAAMKAIDALRGRFEQCRQELTVVPKGYPPVKPAPYFVGDVLEPATWTRYRSQMRERIDGALPAQ